jgi:hypothetical protein
MFNKDFIDVRPEKGKLRLDVHDTNVGTVGVDVTKTAVSIAFERFERDEGGPVVYVDLNNEDGVPHILVFADPASDDPIEINLSAFCVEGR